jgi:lipoprotein-anchoring transpeptidase ErfK/SrfK
MSSNGVWVRAARRVAVSLALAMAAGAIVGVPGAPAGADDFPDRPPADLSVPLVDPTSPTPAVATPIAAVPSATPTAPDAGSGHRIVYSNSKQRVWAYDADGSLVRTYPVSGKRGVPRPGEYNVWSRSPSSRSGSVTLRYMVRFAHGSRMAIGFHEIPVGRRGPIQSIGELGQFRSHGCVRQSPADALFMWNFAPLGTRVTVTA